MDQDPRPHRLYVPAGVLKLAAQTFSALLASQMSWDQGPPRSAKALRYRPSWSTPSRVQFSLLQHFCSSQTGLLLVAAVHRPVCTCCTWVPFPQIYAFL